MLCILHPQPIRYGTVIDPHSPRGCTDYCEIQSASGLLFMPLRGSTCPDVTDDVVTTRRSSPQNTSSTWCVDLKNSCPSCIHKFYRTSTDRHSV